MPGWVSAADAIKSALEALYAQDWNIFVDGVDADELLRFRDSQVQGLRSNLESKPGPSSGLRSFLESFYGTTESEVLARTHPTEVLKR